MYQRNGNYINRIEENDQFNYYLENKLINVFKSKYILFDLFLRRLHFRNKYLIKLIDKNINKHNTIIIPWGAVHYQSVADHLIELGFSATIERRWRVSYFPWLRPFISDYAWKIRDCDAAKMDE